MNDPNFVEQPQSLSRNRYDQRQHKQRRPNHRNNYDRFEKISSQKVDIGNNEGLNIPNKDAKFENFILQETEKNEQRREAKQRQYRRQRPQRPYKNRQFPPKFQDRHFNHEKRRSNNYRRQNKYNDNQSGQTFNKRNSQQRKYNKFEKVQKVHEGSQKIEQKFKVMEINPENQKNKVQIESRPKGQSLEIKSSQQQKQFQDLNQQNVQGILDSQSSDSQSDENQIEKINPSESSEQSKVYPGRVNRRNHERIQPRNKMSQAERQAHRQQKLEQQQQRLIQRQQRRRLNELKRAQRQQLRNFQLSQPEKFPHDHRRNQYQRNQRGGQRQYRNGYNNPRPQKHQRKFEKGNFGNNKYAHYSEHNRNFEYRDRNFIKPLPPSSNQYIENKQYPETEVKQLMPELPSSKTDDSEEDIPESLLCPISQILMNEPILVTVCGHTFEGSIIREWVKKKPVCPLCNSAIADTNKQLIKNFILFDVIAHFKK